jgi:hypothetical protein
VPVRLSYTEKFAPAANHQSQAHWDRAPHITTPWGLHFDLA